MTPANLSKQDLPIFKGAQWSHTFTFYQAGTQTPVNLTGLAPFVCSVKRTNSDTLLANASVVIDDPLTGSILITLTAEQTDEFRVDAVRLGIRDAVNNPYAEGTIAVENFTPDPA